jgi:uncharacterized protein (TIGR02996 family)
LARLESKPISTGYTPAEAALRRAVLARPHDDTPRWDYARWLVRQGNDYGDFLAEQLRHPEQIQIVADDSSWLGPLRTLSVRDAHFQRGFPIAVSVSGRVFLSRGDELFALAPLEWVRLVAVDAVRREFPQSAHLRRLRGLSLHNCRLGPTLEEWLAAGLFDHLEWLDQRGNEVQTF